MDPVIHVSERHQSEMLQGQSGYAREKHAEELASVNNERDFDKVADAPVIQHPHVHFRESWKRPKDKRNCG